MKDSLDMASWSYLSVRRRVREIVAVARPGDHISRAFDISIVMLILLNVAAMIAESVASVRAVLEDDFIAFEYFSVAVFSLEYLLRVWSCVEDPLYAHPVFGRLRFALTPLALVDLLAVLPFYLPFVKMDLRMLRILRIMRIMRLAKLGRYSDSLQTLGRVMGSKKEQLISTVFILVILLVIASCLMYYAENQTQPDHFSSIPAAMWWAVTTLTTVGYGDVFPMTTIGKLLGSVIAVLGICPPAFSGPGSSKRWSAANSPKAAPTVATSFRSEPGLCVIHHFRSHRQRRHGTIVSASRWRSARSAISGCSQIRFSCH
jgi:voltage-gated potassium channel